MWHWALWKYSALQTSLVHGPQMEKISQSDGENTQQYRWINTSPRGFERFEGWRWENIITRTQSMLTGTEGREQRKRRARGERGKHVTPGPVARTEGHIRQKQQRPDHARCTPDSDPRPHDWSSNMSHSQSQTATATSGQRESARKCHTALKARVGNLSERSTVKSCNSF